MKKYLAALLVAVGILLVMAVPAFAQDGCVEEFPGAGSGACELQPGGSSGSRSQIATPPLNKFGSLNRSPNANVNNPDTTTGRGERIL